MAKPLANSLDAIGLQAFMDDDYYKYGGYPKLVAMLEADESDAAIARAFSSEDRPLSRSAPRRWRKRWQLEQSHPELKQGGYPEVQRG